MIRNLGILLLKISAFYVCLTTLLNCSSLLDDTTNPYSDLLNRPVSLNDVDVDVDFNVTSLDNYFVSGTYISSFTPQVTNFFKQSIPSEEYDNPFEKQFDSHKLKSIVNNYQVHLYKVSYDIVSVVTNSTIQVSGLLIMPEVSKNIPLLAFAPGTRLGDDAEVPSKGDQNELYTNLGAILSSSLGFAVFIPDYVGWGDSSNTTHHYMNADEAVQVIINGVEAVFEYGSSLSGTLSASLNNDVIISGYSQGGVAALLSTIYVERFANQYPAINLVASLPMGGVPDLRKHIFQIYNDNAYSLSAFLPYIVMTNNDEYQFYTDVNEIMDSTDSYTIENCILSGDYNLTECNDLIDSNDPLGIYEDVWLNEFLLNLYNGDMDNPLEAFVFENSAYYLMNDWEPQDHLGYRFYHCAGDTYTFYDNDNEFVDYIKSEKEANAMMVNFGDLDHTECILPSITDAMYWLLVKY